MTTAPGWKNTSTGDVKNSKNPDGTRFHNPFFCIYRYTSASDLGATPLSCGVGTYGGGGYVFPLKGYIGDVNDKVETLKKMNWINNRTRAVIVEFSVYNAQVNMFGIVTAAAEFVGGGIRPWFKVDAIRLFANVDGFGFVALAAEVLFVVATFYYVVNVVVTLKREGCRAFCNSTWNIIDMFTVVLSLIALVLYVVSAKKPKPPD